MKLLISRKFIFITFFIGIGCIILKSLLPEYVDYTGLLHEYFFLIPIGFLFIFLSLILLLIKNVKTRFHKYQSHH
ncbi:DUF3955 domain-containing protein [Staphylococcus sp. 11007852]|uniref:DUF3955 domain-containing protein n=1 Tax=Staphylococcus TaxID=1279 RepID=UPI001402428A|nr:MULTISPECIES: DUF3955 domain-containing protein [Staphylococcus]NHM73892.1 DUF3955 domain-containing protein [Staphylococcus sp. 11007852]NJH82568.1 DUF3955 domain-containing protein [Staphylococcus agnetis]